MCKSFIHLPNGLVNIPVKVRPFASYTEQWYVYANEYIRINFKLISLHRLTCYQFICQLYKRYLRCFFNIVQLMDATLTAIVIYLCGLAAKNRNLWPSSLLKIDHKKRVRLTRGSVLWCAKRSKKTCRDNRLFLNARSRKFEVFTALW